jgi:hypothetical protein
MCQHNKLPNYLIKLSYKSGILKYQFIAHLITEQMLFFLFYVLILTQESPSLD